MNENNKEIVLVFVGGYAPVNIRRNGFRGRLS